MFIHSSIYMRTFEKTYIWVYIYILYKYIRCVKKLLHITNNQVLSCTAKNCDTNVLCIPNLNVCMHIRIEKLYTYSIIEHVIN